MPAVLMTLFAVSILGALGMAVYGLRVLVGRWEQPRRLKVQHSLPQLAPVNPPQPSPPAPPAIWVHPAGVAPAPMVPLLGVATPPPIRIPSAELSAVPPPLPPSVATRSPRPPSTPVFAPVPAWTPPARAPSPAHPRPATSPRALSARLARGSIPPDYPADLEPDTDPGVPEIVEPEAEVMHGERYSVIRSSRR